MNLIEAYTKYWASEDNDVTAIELHKTVPSKSMADIVMQDAGKVMLTHALSFMEKVVQTEHHDSLSMALRGEETRRTLDQILFETTITLFRFENADTARGQALPLLNKDIREADINILWQEFNDSKLFMLIRNYENCCHCDTSNQICVLVKDGKVMFVTENKECFNETIQKFTFTVKKGDTVLMGDWLGALPRNAPGHPSLNTIKGSFDTYTYYNTFNAVNFGVGNSCPTVYRRGDDFSFGIRGEGEGWENIGSICTDLWAVTIMTERDIDRIEKDTGEKAQKDRADVQFEATEDMVFEVTYDHTVSSWDWEVDEETEEYIGKPFATMKLVK